MTEAIGTIEQDTFFHGRKTLANKEYNGKIIYYVDVAFYMDKCGRACVSPDMKIETVKRSYKEYYCLNIAKQVFHKSIITDLREQKEEFLRIPIVEICNSCDYIRINFEGHLYCFLTKKEVQDPLTENCKEYKVMDPAF